MEKENFKNLSKTFIAVNAVFFALITTFNCLIMFTDITQYIVKTIASVLFVACGVFNFVYAKKHFNNQTKKFAILMLIGLVFAMLGDILIIDNFVIGAALFALGHVFFAIAFITLSKIKLLDIIIWAAILGISIGLLLLDLYDFNGLFIVIIAYAVIISVMLAKTIGNFVTSKTINKGILMWIMVAASLFFFSDLMLVFDIFGKSDSRAFGILCLSTYYLAEFMFASSIAILPLFNKSKE